MRFDRKTLGALCAVSVLLVGCSAVTDEPGAAESATGTDPGSASQDRTQPLSTSCIPMWLRELNDVEPLVATTTRIAIGVVAGLNDPEPDLFLSQFRPGSEVIDPIVPRLTPSVSSWFASERTLCTVWTAEEVFVNEEGSLTTGACVGFYEPVDGPPELKGIRHLPMHLGLAAGLMHFLDVDALERYPEETVTIIGFPESVGAEVTEQVQFARSFEEHLVEAWDSGDAASVMALYSANGVREDGFAGVAPTPEGTRDWLATLFGHYEDARLSVEELYASGLGPAAVYRITMRRDGSECSVRLASVWFVDDEGLIEREAVFYAPEVLGEIP